MLITVASLAALAGSLTMRIQVMNQGDESARRPEVSMRFAYSEEHASGWRVGRNPGLPSHAVDVALGGR